MRLIYFNELKISKQIYETSIEFKQSINFLLFDLCIDVVSIMEINIENSKELTFMRYN